MKLNLWWMIVALSVASTSCSNPERSRNLADPNVKATTLAQQVCSNCHGNEGRSINPNFPNLAAQQPDYIVEQLKSFRSHNRSDPAGFEYMWGLSRSLTDQQVKGLADYYASRKPASPGAASNPEQIQHGEDIFEHGVSDKNIPPCATCHGEHAQGNAQFPRLAQQHSDYIVKQLYVFQRTDQRPEGGVMKTIVHDLTPQNMRDVAAYLQQLR